MYSRIMPINEDFNPNPKKTLVDYVDDSMLEFHKKIATVWQNKTHLSKRNLEKRLRIGGATAWGVSAAGIGIAFSPWSAGLPILEGMTDLAILYLDYQEIGNNSPPSETEKITRVGKGLGALSYFLSVGLVAYMTGNLAAKIISKEPDINSTLFSGAYLSWSLAMLQDSTARYLSRVSMKNPPKKKKKEVWQEINKKLEVYSPRKKPESIPQPLPQPVPKPSYIQPYSELPFSD